MEEHEKILTKTINLKYYLQRKTKNLNYLAGDIIYKIFRIITSIPLKNIKQYVIIRQ